MELPNMNATTLSFTGTYRGVNYTAQYREYSVLDIELATYKSRPQLARAIARTLALDIELHLVSSGGRTNSKEMFFNYIYHCSQ